ncbi:C-type lectin domain family 19 member A-like [Branchiostoma lanceolatum]|uniref:C-type lectin domain family 19 member A-like n=1 Tax=Branchiostoma lanceolatum TaxID=7740 RepID=UPI003456E8EA
MPRDAETNTFIVSLIDPDTYFWIGLHDRREEGTFEWVDGAPLGNFSAWGGGQPDDHESAEDCVHYQLNVESWNDAPCHHHMPFICQVVSGPA